MSAPAGLSKEIASSSKVDAQAQPSDDCWAMTTALADPPSNCGRALVTDTKKPRNHKRATGVGGGLA